MALPATSFPKTEIKVLLLENIHESAHELFRAEGFQVQMVPSALKEDELRRKLTDVHVLGIRSKTQITDGALTEARRLIGIGCFCIGTNQVDLKATRQRGIPVFNAPFSNTRSVAEMILAEVIVLSRQLGDRSREMHEGKWRKVSLGSFETRGKTLGIVGYGHIGSQLGVLVEMLGMRVLYHDVASCLPMGNNRATASLDELLAESDFVSLHVPETPQTKDMIGHAQLAKMRPGSYLLNASRGTVVDIAALAAALRSGHLAGAAVDVFPVEPESNTDDFATELRGLRNVILTPHIGGSTSEAQAAIGREVASALLRNMNSGATTGSVNFPHVELPQSIGKHRILNIHKNVPGVLRDIHRIVSETGANIVAQVLATDQDIGYLVMDVDQDVSNDVNRAVGNLATSIKTRILY